MTDRFLDYTHTNSGDGDGWADQTGAGGAFNTIPLAVTGGLIAGDILYIRHMKTDKTGDETWTGPTANAGLPIMVLGVKAATTATPPVNSDLIDGQWEGSADPAWDTPAEALPGVGSTSDAFDIIINGNWFFYATNIDPAGNLTITTGNADADQTYVECGLSAGDAVNTKFMNFGSAGSEQGIKIGLINCEVVSTRAQWRMNLARSGLLSIIGGKLTATVAPSSVFGTGVGDMNLYANGFDMSAVGAGNILEIDTNVQSLQAKFVNCAKGSGALVTGSINDRPWRVESYNTDANPGTTLTSAGAILDLEIQDQKGEIVQSEVTFRNAGADDRTSGNYSLAITGTTGNLTQPYRGIEGPWNMLRMGSGLETTMTVHIANDSAGDLNDDDVRIEVLQPNGSGDLAANEYKFKGMSLLGTPAAMTDGTDGDWTFDTGDGNAQEIAVTIDPAYQGTIYWRAINYTTNTVYVDPLPVLS